MSMEDKIKEQTGLKTQKSVEAYWVFCHSADWDDGVILYGGVERDLGSTKRFNYWLKRFQQLGLVSLLRQVRRCSQLFPVLLGYNPMNDGELYIPYRKSGEERWSGRLSTKASDLEIERMKSLGYEFKNVLDRPPRLG